MHKQPALPEVTFIAAVKLITPLIEYIKNLKYVCFWKKETPALAYNLVSTQVTSRVQQNCQFANVVTRAIQCFEGQHKQ